MAPKTKSIKRSAEDSSDDKSYTKRSSRSDIEKHICKKKLDALGFEEGQNREDRFSFEEKKRLLDAFNEHGFHVFENTNLLHQYFPARRECDLKGLVQRLRVNCADPKVERSQPIDDWQKLCHQLMGNFAKSRHINLDDIFADALKLEAESRLQKLSSCSTTCDSANDANTNHIKADFPHLIKNFAQLLQGKFPDSMNPINAQISMKLFEHVNNVADSIDINKLLSSVLDGSWLDSVMEERRIKQDMALKGLEEIDGMMKKCPTMRDIEKNKNIEALCLELPKIKRITDVLNPLSLSELESLVKS